MVYAVNSVMCAEHETHQATVYKGLQAVSRNKSFDRVKPGPIFHSMFTSSFTSSLIALMKEIRPSAAFPLYFYSDVLPIVRIPGQSFNLLGGKHFNRQACNRLGQRLAVVVPKKRSPFSGNEEPDGQGAHAANSRKSANKQKARHTQPLKRNMTCLLVNHPCLRKAHFM